MVLMLQCLQIWDPKYLKEGGWDQNGRREIFR